MLALSIAFGIGVLAVRLGSATALALVACALAATLAAALAGLPAAEPGRTVSALLCILVFNAGLSLPVVMGIVLPRRGFDR